MSRAIQICWIDIYLCIFKLQGGAGGIGGQTSLIFPETSQRNIVRADMNNEEHGKMSRSMFRDLGEADKES